MNKVYIGKVKKDYKSNYVSGEIIYLEKHSWDCGWYWGFGYVGNRNLHCHFDGAFLKDAAYTPKEIFDDCIFNEKEWWIMRDLFVQAYALKAAAEVYRHGGHQTTSKGITDIIQDLEMSDRLNKNLKTVLDKIWDMVEMANNRKYNIETTTGGKTHGLHV